MKDKGLLALEGDSLSLSLHLDLSAFLSPSLSLTRADLSFLGTHTHTHTHTQTHTETHTEFKAGETALLWVCGLIRTCPPRLRAVRVNS